MLFQPTNVCWTRSLKESLCSVLEYEGIKPHLYLGIKTKTKKIQSYSSMSLQTIWENMT